MCKCIDLQVQYMRQKEAPSTLVKSDGTAMPLVQMGSLQTGILQSNWAHVMADGIIDVMHRELPIGGSFHLQR